MEPIKKTKEEELEEKKRRMQQFEYEHELELKKFPIKHCGDWEEIEGGGARIFKERHCKKGEKS